jgi:hypothetical protein
MEIEAVHYTKKRDWQLKPIVINNRNSFGKKPTGGLWTSPVNSSWGWKDWCESEDFGDLRLCRKIYLSVSLNNALVIDSERDLQKLTWRNNPITRFPKLELPFGFGSSPDFERMREKGIEVIHLTEQGQWDTCLSEPLNLYGWDCESLLILSTNAVKSWVTEVEHDFAEETTQQG